MLNDKSGIYVLIYVEKCGTQVLNKLTRLEHLKFKRITNRSSNDIPDRILNDLSTNVLV
jgi:hypothetical protein